MSSDTLLKRLRKYSPAEQLNSVKIKCALYYIIEKHFNYLAKNKIRSGLGLVNIIYWSDISELGQYIITYLYSPELFKNGKISNAQTDWIFIGDFMNKVEHEYNSCSTKLKILHNQNKILLNQIKIQNKLATQ